MDDQTLYAPGTNRQILLGLNILIAILVIISAIYILLTYTGYSKVSFVVPNGSTVNINGHLISANNLRMVPGKYNVVVSSPTINPYQSVLNVGVYQTIIFKPLVNQRSPESIASSLLGGAGQSGALQFGLVRWFDNSTWVAGLVGPNEAGLALQYDGAQAQWKVAYYNGGGYPEDLTKIPTPVAAYIEQLEAQNVQG